MLPSLFEIDLCVNLSHVSFILALNHHADGKGNLKQLELPIVEHLVPEHRHELDVERVGKQRRDPRMQQHVARGLVLQQVGVQ